MLCGGDGDVGGVSALDFNLTAADVGVAPVTPNMTSAATLLEYERVRAAINQVALPVIFGIGIAGNLLNVVVLATRHREPRVTSGGVSTRPSAFERSAAIGLIALTMSDLAFCLVGFSRLLVSAGGRSSLPAIYYSVYHIPFHNLFLFTSTWIIALVSVERYLAVCHPYRATSIIHVRRTVFAHLVVVAASVLVNVPLFVRNTIVTMSCPVRVSAESPNTTCGTCYLAQPSRLIQSHPGVFYAHKIAWFVVGTFVPLLLIVYSNVRLVREICLIHSNAAAAAVGASSISSTASAAPSAAAAISKERSSTLTLTLTLVAIAVCFLVLVCPSMIVQFVRSAGRGGTRIVGVDEDWTSNPVEQMAIVVTNLTQAIKFSSNFLLYCIVSRAFRRSFGKLLRRRPGGCGRRQRRDSADTLQVNMALVHTAV